MNSSSFLARITALALSIFILIGTGGVSADFHICQGDIKTLSFFGEAEKCSAIEETVTCQKSKNPVIDKKHCCSNKNISQIASFQAEVYSSTNFIKTDIHIEAVTTSFSISTLHIEEDVSILPNPPPLYEQNSRTIVFQHFLI